MSERLKPTDVPGQPGSIQNTRQIIDALMRHTSFSGADAGELLFGLDRLEAETEAEKVLKAPQVQDARGVVSSMLEKGFILKEPADNFFTLLNDPETAHLLRRDILPVITGVGRRRFLVGVAFDLLKRDVPPVISPDSEVTQKGIDRRRFLLVGILALEGLAITAIGYEVVKNFSRTPGVK